MSWRYKSWSSYIHISKQSTLQSLPPQPPNQKDTSGYAQAQKEKEIKKIN